MSSLSIPQYLSDLQQLQHQHHLDWHSPATGTYEKKVGRLTLQLQVCSSAMTKWVILHERGGRLSNGSSESGTMAMLEMLKYAEHWVRTAMVGLMA